MPKALFPPRLELGTFRVLGERDNHYTTETSTTSLAYISYWFETSLQLCLNYVWHISYDNIVRSYIRVKDLSQISPSRQYESDKTA